MAARGPPNAFANPQNPYGQSGGYPTQSDPYLGGTSTNSSQVPLAGPYDSSQYDSYCAS
jgi:hypothetical protein